ncbi:MAG: hypothetical protein FIA82_10960 [Melioribacter sp.]|nr:hypothetical protein [Melioribacter sp.]
MKKYFLLLFIAGLILSGCSSDENLLVSPKQNSNVEQSQLLVIETGFLNLPVTKQTGNNVTSDLTDAALINGNKGGELEVEGKFGISKSGVVEVHGALNIPQGAFKGFKTISMSADKGSTSVTFGPSGSYFDKSLLLDLEYKGLNLIGIDVTKIKFVYLSSDGIYSIIPNDGIQVDVKEGKLEVHGAQIDHFSRFGFVR